MALDPAILSLMVCPETHASLAMAEQTLIDDLNARIGRGELSTRSGKAVTELLSAGLVRDDGKCLYRVDDDIPNLLVEDRIDL